MGNSDINGPKQDRATSTAESRDTGSRVVLNPETGYVDITGPIIPLTPEQSLMFCFDILSVIRRVVIRGQAAIAEHLLDGYHE